MLRMMSLSAGELLHRVAVAEALRSAAEADAAIRAQKCGRACDDLSGFESALAELVQERVR
jgi:hypothetical protein